MTTQLPPFVASFVEIVNAGDVVGFLDSFTPNGMVIDGGREFCDREAIRAWSDREFLGAGARLSVAEIASGDSSVEVVADWHSRHANGRSRFDFALVGDKIAVMRIRALGQ